MCADGSARSYRFYDRARGRNGGGVGCLWRRKKEEENMQREREDLAVAAPIANEDLGS